MPMLRSRDFSALWPRNDMRAEQLQLFKVFRFSSVISPQPITNAWLGDNVGGPGGVGL